MDNVELPVCCPKCGGCEYADLDESRVEWPNRPMKLPSGRTHTGIVTVHVQCRCGQTFIVRRPLRETEPDRPTQPAKYPCRYCARTLKSERGRTQHEKAAHHKKWLADNPEEADDLLPADVAAPQHNDTWEDT